MAACIRLQQRRQTGQRLDTVIIWAGLPGSRQRFAQHRLAHANRQIRQQRGQRLRTHQVVANPVGLLQQAGDQPADQRPRQAGQQRGMRLGAQVFGLHLPGNQPGLHQGAPACQRRQFAGQGCQGLDAHQIMRLASRCQGLG